MSKVFTTALFLSVWRAAAADVGCGCARLGLLNQHSHHHHMLNHPVLVLINISFLESFLSDSCSFASFSAKNTKALDVLGFVYLVYSLMQGC